MVLRFSFWGVALVAALALAPARAGEGSGAPGPQGFRWAMPAWTPAPPVPEDNPMTAAKVELGRRLFYDARLSADGTTACASCHLQALAFTDGRARAEGVHGATGHRNAPSLANVGYFPTLTWANPHLDRLEIQALVPLFGTEPEEMGLAGREDAVFARLAADPWYARAFPAAFPERSAPDLATVTHALAAFQRSLISVDSAYDRARRGGAPEAMSPAARRGEARRCSSTTDWNATTATAACISPTTARPRAAASPRAPITTPGSTISTGPGPIRPLARASRSSPAGPRTWAGSARPRCATSR
jgi:cytochrome c peroxidase